MITIQNPAKPPHPFALFNLGFRPFFLLAGLFSIVAVLLWGGIIVYGWPAPRMVYALSQWHAHEMIYGYAMAVVAGFLLTAVRNWTNVPTVTGQPLGGLAALWLAARVAGLAMPQQVWLMAGLDVAFNLLLCVAIAQPIIRAKQKQQAGILLIMALLTLGNALFYSGALGYLAQGIAWGLYGGLYLIISLIFVMARRVVPFFIERGVEYEVMLQNRAWVDRSSLILLLLFLIAEVFLRWDGIAAGLAALLAGVHGVRLHGWHTPGIWRKPLLWVLFVGYAGAVFGFLLKALTPVLGLSPTLAVHAFALGGISMMTVGMMARVALGHTGRSIQEPVRGLPPIFILLAAAFVARVLLPLAAPAHYLVWLAFAQAFWISAYALFFLIYLPILIKPRVDGMPG
ncbi:MAG: NnrS family protein [Hydrogenophilales bacterium]|nr:NnrS family protein [Hydrogenophilales bacterium]